MKDHTVNFKQCNMLCDKCLINVAKYLSNIHGIEALEISLKSKKIKIIYNDNTISKKMIKDKVNETILTGKVKNIYGFSS